MARNVKFSFLRGGGSSLEVLYGKVSLTPTNLHTLSSTAVLPAPTTFDLVNGTALATNVAPTPAPVDGTIAWAYKVKITDNYSKTWEYLVGVPDGTTEINFNVLPRYSESRPPAFGVGPAGPAGQSATIAIGTTTSGATPAVTNTGTSTDAVLNFTLAKGDKGDTGAGVPTGGTALQVVRKNAANTTTEWAAADKALVGLGNVDNTSDVNKPVSVAQKTYIDQHNLIPYNTKLVSDAANTYPEGVSVYRGHTDSGWPNNSTNSTSIVVVNTTRSQGVSGGATQVISDYYQGNLPLLYRVANPDHSWGEFKAFATAGDISRGIMANVREFGAVGDSVVDDTASIQAAMDFLKTVGGGRLYFPPGDYYVRSGVYLTSNVEIFGSGATLRKKSSSDPSYCVFIGSSGSQQGYGAGPSNIYMHDLSFRGKFGSGGRGLCVMGLHHSENVTVERVDIEEASSGGHRFDLGGCRNIIIRDSVFRGFDDSQAGLYNEDIQPDYSNKRSGSFLEQDVSSYDGLPSTRVKVENCKFLPLTIEGKTYPAANPFGTHGTVYERYCSDLVFRGNTVINPVSDTGTTVPATLHFVGVKNLRIEDNVFIGENNPICAAVYVYVSTAGASPSNVQTDLPSVAYPVPMVSQDITIRNNYFTGWHTATYVVRVAGTSNQQLYSRGLRFEGNVLDKMNATSGVTNVGSIPVSLDWTKGSVVSGNTVSRARKWGNFTNCQDLVIDSNIGETNALNDFSFSGNSRVTFSNNAFSSIKAFCFYTSGPNTDVSITGNSFEGNNSGASPQVRLGDISGVTCTGNTLRGESGLSALGIQATGTTYGVIANNALSGFSTPLTPAATTSDVVVSNNLSRA